MTCDGLTSRPGGVEILPEPLHATETGISSVSYELAWLQGFTFIWLSPTIIVNHVDAHFEGFSVR